MIATLFAAAAAAVSSSGLWDAIVQALPVIFGLILIEGLLSVDNALAIAAMAAHLDDRERTKAMNIGYLGAYGFRLAALLFASWIISNHWVMLLGALYLVWLMCAHFASQKGVGDEDGEAVNVHHRTFAGTVTMIALMDLSLSVDNVVAAIALSPNDLWPVYVGVTIGIISLRLVAGLALKMISKYPVLEHTAFILIGYVGLLLLTELQYPAFFDELGPTKVKLLKFVGILLLTALTLLWSRKAWLQRLLSPLLIVLMLPMRLFATLIGAVIVVITWPVKKTAEAMRR
ncbi:MAG: hypothetical protein LDL31_07355 [Prosthecobacter sp.]|nr:hypothetical protein [Prosthecobacter sp.]